MTATVAIVTCGPQLEVALRVAGQNAASLVRLAGVSPRSTLLLAAVDLMLEDSGIEPTALLQVVISRGPGSFTGIRAGIASAAGLEAATGAAVLAFDSLTVQAARCGEAETVWAAQPGRRGEVYAQPFQIAAERAPKPLRELEIVAVVDAHQRGPWIAAEALDLGGARRAQPLRSAAEALLVLVDQGAAAQPVEPLYVEDPPIHSGGGSG